MPLPSQSYNVVGQKKISKFINKIFLVEINAMMKSIVGVSE